MSELADNLNDYKFTWSTPWELSEEEQRVLCLKLAQVVAEAMPWIGAASLKVLSVQEDSDAD